MESRDQLFMFEAKPSDSPWVEAIWHTHSNKGGEFISQAETNWGLVITRQAGVVSVTVRGPETVARPAPVPTKAEFLGISFKLGTYMPILPAKDLVNAPANLPEATSQSFWLNGSAWEFPTFENIDTFIARLVRQGLIAHEPLVQATLQGQVADLSARTVQRRFWQATGLTHGAVRQIQRAQEATALLRKGLSILDTVEQAGYSDQPHLTRSLRKLMGQTPAEIAKIFMPY
jgi:AraC-like DNA-binding protein